MKGKRPPKCIRKKTEIMGRRELHQTCEREQEILLSTNSQMNIEKISFKFK